MKVGRYEIFEKVNKENAIIILSEMRDSFTEELRLWKKESGMYKLFENEIDAIDLAIDQLKAGVNNGKAE